jgi:hypothetical protein
MDEKTWVASIFVAAFAAVNPDANVCLLLYDVQFWDVPSDEYRAVEAPVFKNTHVVILTFTLLKKHTYATPRPVMLYKDIYMSPGSPGLVVYCSA